MSAQVIPIASDPEGHGEEWAELEIKLPPPRAWIPAGLYQARTAGLKILDGFDRKTAELLFEVYKGEWTDAVVLATIPMFLRVPGKKGLSPNSIGVAPPTQYPWSWRVPPPRIAPATLSTPCSTPSFGSTSISSSVKSRTAATVGACPATSSRSFASS